MKLFATKAIMALATALITASHVTAQDCQSQGTGHCQLYLTADHMFTTGVGHSYAGSMIWRHATIYNWRCDVIGGHDNPYSGLAIYSELPYAVIIDSIGYSALSPYYIAFRYAGYSFKGKFWCSATQVEQDDWDTYETVRCIHSFPC